MATKRMHSLTAPAIGLTDTYTVPQTVAELEDGNTVATKTEVSAEATARANADSQIFSDLVNLENCADGTITKELKEDLVNYAITRTNQLFNKKESSIINGYINNGVIAYSGSTKSIIFNISNSDKQITFHRGILSSRFRVATFDKENPQIGDAFIRMYSPDNESTTENMIIDNLNGNEKSIALYFYHSSFDSGLDIDEYINSLMVQSGSKYTGYEEYYQPILKPELESMESEVDDLSKRIDANSNDKLKRNVIAINRKEYVFEYNTLSNTKYMLNISDIVGTLSSVSVFLYNSDSDCRQVALLSDDIVFVNGNSAYSKIKVYANGYQTGTTYNLMISAYNDNLSPSILIIGDSYSESKLWINELQKKVVLGNIVNLGVSSATLKDKSTDRNANPYTSRPISNDTRGLNYNTFGSQIEKLKRLMIGEDLDVGESKLYENEGDYPNIIFIEGGTNDSLDATTDTYISQMYTVVNGYVKSKTSAEKTLQDVMLPVNYNDTNRTTFAGAMHYLYGFMKETFPNAKIFFITPSGLSYATGNNKDYLKKGEQIKLSASMLSTPVIDWGVNGRLTYVDNVVSGDGTEENPYIYNDGGIYSGDGLHPNKEGAKLLSDEVAKEIVSYGLVRYISFIDIS